MLRRMRVALGFALMTIGALGTAVGTARSSQGAGTRSNRPLVPPSESRRPPSSRPSRIEGPREPERPIPGAEWSQKTVPGPEIPGRGGLRAAVESRMQQLVAEQLGVDTEQLAPEVSLTDDLAADSLDLLELALVLESEFTVALPQRRVGQIRTYRDLVDAVMASADGRQWRERLTSRPLAVKSRVVSARDQSASLERAGELTPYAMEVIAEDAARAGRGARLEVTMPASADDLDLAVVREELAHLGRRGVEVRVRRDVGAGEES
jgi:acyl carrier protein